jgi:microcystin-dependent protein
LCNGQTLPINQNQALFALLGTTYGGNGQTTFALPDLRGRVPLHTGGSFTTLGERAGEEAHTLNALEAAHSHAGIGNATTADQAAPTGHFWGNAGLSNYAAFANSSMAATVSTVGGGQSHENRSPYLTLNFVIALVGIFPSRN